MEAVIEQKRKNKIVHLWNSIWGNRWYPLLLMGILFTITLAFVLIYSGVNGGFFHMNSDDYVQYYPYVEAFYDKLKTGSFSLYDTNLFGGVSYFSAAYYIPLDLFTFIGFLLSFFMQGETAYCISNFLRPAAGAFILYYTFSRKMNYKTAFLAGLILFCGGTTEAYYIFPVYLGICVYAPLAMLLVDWCIEKRGPYYLFLPLYSVIVIFYDFYIAYMLIAFICIYFVIALNINGVCSILGKDCFLWNKNFYHRFFEFLGLILLGVLMGACMLLPAALYIMHQTSRNSSMTIPEMIMQLIKPDKSKESYWYFSKYSSEKEGYILSIRHYFTQLTNLFMPNDPHCFCLVEAGDYVREHCSLYMTTGGLVYLVYFFFSKGKLEFRLKGWVIFLNILLLIPIFSIIFGLNSSPYVRWFFIPYFINLYAMAVGMESKTEHSHFFYIAPLLVLFIGLGCFIYVITKNPDTFIHYSAPDLLFYLFVIPTILAISLYIIAIVVMLAIKRTSWNGKLLPILIFLEFIFGTVAIFANVDNTSDRYYNSKISSETFKNELTNIYSYSDTSGYRIHNFTIYGREITNNNILTGNVNFGRFFQSFYNTELNTCLNDIYSESSTSWTRTFNNGYSLLNGPIFNERYVIMNENATMPEEFYTMTEKNGIRYYEAKEEIPFIVYDQGYTNTFELNTFSKQLSVLYYAYFPEEDEALQEKLNNTGLELKSSIQAQKSLSSYFNSRTLPYRETLGNEGGMKYYIYDIEALGNAFPKDACYIWLSSSDLRKMTHGFLWACKEIPEDLDFGDEVLLHYTNAYFNFSDYKYLVVEATGEETTSGRIYSYSYDAYRDFASKQREYTNKSFSLKGTKMHITVTMPEENKTRIIKTGYTYSDEWKIDTEGYETINVDGGFLGIIVKENIKDVDITLSFHPEGFATGVKFSIAGFVIYAIISGVFGGILLYYRKKEKMTPKQEG